MRILVDNSGYHLLNLGDISMLQAAVSRLRSLWPDASIEVVTYSEERLALYCPGALPVGAGFLTHPLVRYLPRKARYGLVQLYKILLPLLLALLRVGRKRPGSAPPPARQGPTGLWDALAGADLFVASGGGYITDSFWIHGLGVLTLLHYAQAVGKPAAMFGQGIGPLRPGFVRDYARRVLPGVDIITLREGRFGPQILRDLGVDPARVLVTGDDAVETACAARPEQLGGGLGVNLRIARYSGVDPQIAAGVKAVLQDAARRFAAPLVPVPISLYKEDSDSDAIDFLVEGYGGEVVRCGPVLTPHEAIRQAGKCRALVTGSYHAAVYALAQGVPAVCLTRSGYYDCKFAGLVDLYPEACRVVSLSDPACQEKLADAVAQAWLSAGSTRPQTLLRAADQARLSQQAYQRLVHCKLLFQPILLLDIDLGGPLPSLSSLDPSTGRIYTRARLLVRLRGCPLGFVDIPLTETVTVEHTAGCIWQALHDSINRFLQRNGLEPVAALPPAGLSLPVDLPILAKRRAVLAASPSICVVICTRDRAASLARTLDDLLRMNYPNFELLVVDNAPASDETADMVRSRYAGCPQVRYVREDRPGLSWARNCGLRSTTAEIVAYIDDDETPDPYWLAEIALGFRSSGRVACVTGAIIPAEIETQPQEWFEQYGGHSKGRGFEPVIFQAGSGASQSLLFPNPPYGAGGNMAYNAAVLRMIGGFDPALGAGTFARGGEDTAAFYHVLKKGYSLVFSPAALVRHFHYRDYNALKRQFEGYGVGLAAFYVHCLLQDPACIFELLGQVPKGFALFLRPFRKKRAPVGQVASEDASQAAYPAELIGVKLRGMLRGPFAYLRSLQVAKQIQ